MADDSCCRSGTFDSGTPLGSVQTIAGVESYVTKSATPTTRVILLATDVFGHQLINTRLVADAMAAAGFDVYVPDILNGDALAANAIPLGDRPMTFGAKVRQGLKFVAAVPSLLPWFSRHGDETHLPPMQKVLAELRSRNPAPTGIAICGYCFGGRNAVLLAQQGKKNGLDAFAVAHPSRIAAADVEKVAIPGLFLLAESDGVFSAAEAAKSEAAVKAAGRVETKWITNPNTQHGFAIRGDNNIPEVRKARAAALVEMTSWFDKHLPSTAATAAAPAATAEPTPTTAEPAAAAPAATVAASSEATAPVESAPAADAATADAPAATATA